MEIKALADRLSGACTLAVFGPTASGKSALAARLAGALGGEVLSCDSMAVYRGLPVLANHPEPALRALATHHLLGHVPPSQSYSAGRYAKQAALLEAQVRARGALPIYCGGTGLYLRAALGSLSMNPPLDVEAVQRWEALWMERGPAYCYGVLLKKAPQVAARLSESDKRRVIRALGLQEQGHKTRSGELWSLPAGVRVIGLNPDPALLRQKIERRTRSMFKRGVVEEVSQVLKLGPSPTLRRAHGFAEIAATLEGQLSLEEAQTQMILNTQRYAKRQRTWLRALLRANPDQVIELTELPDYGS